MKGSDILVGALSDIGNVRKINEDFVGWHIDEKKAIYIVADGMGGHNAGEVASKAVVESTIEFINNNEDRLQQPDSILSDAILYSNKKIYDLSSSSSGLSGMGTTITAVLKVQQGIYIANVGDSGCFIIKNGNIKKITKDHSLVQELIDEGSITEEQAKKHPNKNIITRAVGTSEKVLVDIFYASYNEADKIILCSDGLSNEVTAEEMLEYTEKCDNSTACEELVHLAKARGGRDNISVMIFEGVDNHDRDDIRG